VFGKLATLIACIAACGGWLLSLRHERVQALSELTQAQLRINRQDERLWMLRTQVAERITPPRIEALAAGLVDLQPIIPSEVFTPDQLAMMKQGKGTGPELIGPPLPPGMVEEAKVAMGGPGRDAQAAPTRVPSRQVKASPAKASSSKATPSKAAASKSEGRKQAKPPAPKRVARRDRNGEEN
jgi:hypothetical protein